MNLKLKRRLFACLAIMLPLCMTTANDGKNKVKDETSIPYWYFNVGYETPFMCGDMYSFTREKNHFGVGPNIRLGYRFNSVFSLEMKALYARMKGYNPSVSNKFVLGEDGMTYYHYTLIDGDKYVDKFGPDDTWGIWGDNPVQMNGAHYSKVYSKTRQFQVGLLGSLNLNRLFMSTPSDRVQKVTLFLKPGIYANKYIASTHFKVNDRPAAPKYRSPLSIGLGGELAVNWSISRHFGLEFYGGAMWVSDQQFDGIKTIKRAKDDFTWTVGANLNFKFPTSSKGNAAVENIDMNLPLKEKAVAYDNFLLTPFVPILGERKVRTHEEVANFVFALSKTNLRPGLGHNQMYIEKIDASYRKLKKESDITIKNITIEGYASPEGPARKNHYLAEYRAKDVAKYLVAAYGYPYSIVDSRGCGENWDGLRKALEQWDNPGKDKLLNILNAKMSLEKKKEQLRKCGAIYKKALEEIYPDLRMDKCVFTYEIKPYNLEQCISKFVTNPDMLSANEMVAVINQYPMYSVEFENSLNKAFSFYPNNGMLIAYKAACLLKKKHAEEALVYLNKTADNDVTLMLKGVAYLQLGDKEKAMDCLTKSKELGNKDAEENLTLIK